MRLNNLIRSLLQNHGPNAFRNSQLHRVWWGFRAGHPHGHVHWWCADLAWHLGKTKVLSLSDPHFVAYVSLYAYTNMHVQIFMYLHILSNIYIYIFWHFIWHYFCLTGLTTGNRHSQECIKALFHSFLHGWRHWSSVKAQSSPGTAEGGVAWSINNFESWWVIVKS